MRNLKKVLALVLACAMVFGTVAMAGSIYPDVADDAVYAEAVKTLSALGIFKGDENGNFNPDATITRAEMAKIICTMIGTGELSTTATQFKDVAADHWASGYIMYAKGLGIIDGYDAETFGPEDPVLYEQVVKLVMATLGYTHKANENGGYPTGYLYVAADMEVTKAAVGGSKDPATRSTVAIIVNNAMDTPMMERVTYGTEAVWKVLDGTNETTFKSLLTQKHHVYRVEGTVLDSSRNNVNLKAGYVNTYITDPLQINATAVLGGRSINNIETTDKFAPDFVGYASYLYYKKLDNGEIILVCVNPRSSRNQSVAIDAKQIFDIAEGDDIADAPTFDGTKLVFTYWNDRDNDNRISKIDVDPFAAFYYNDGVGSTIISAAGINTTTASDGTVTITDSNATVAAAFYGLLKIARGTLTFVDTDNDGDYDLIKAAEYHVAVVESVNPNTNRINFKPERAIPAGSITLNTDANKYLAEYTITLDGAAIDVKDLQEYDVLNVMTNAWNHAGTAADPTYFTIDVTRNVVEGEVTQVSSTNDYVVINGEKYEVADTIPVGNPNYPALEDSGKFYLDSNGDIAFVVAESAVNGNYGYLYGMGDGTFGEKYVRMFTKDGADASYEISSKIRINDVYESTADTDEVYTEDEVEAIFDLDDGVVETSPVPVANVFELVSPAPSGTPETLGANLTAKDLIAGLASKYYQLTATYAAQFIANTAVDNFITYKIDSDNKLVELSIPVAGQAIDEFGYLGYASNKEWKASLNKFDGSSSVPSNAVVFRVDPARTIEDYRVMTAADLNDGTSYTPYFFSKTDDGPSAILMLNVDSNLGTTLATFVEGANAKDGLDDVTNVTYWENGALVEAPLVVERTVYNNAGLTRGDVFIYSKNEKGRVEDIHVVFSPYGELAKGNTLVGAYMDRVNVTGIAQDFKVYDDTTNLVADSEVYFGAVGKIASTDKGIRATLVTKSGAFDNTAKTFIIPDAATVTLYNEAMPEAKIIGAGTKSDITASFFAKDAAGNIDWAGTVLGDMRYAFVRVYKDVVTDVMFVQYARD